MGKQDKQPKKKWNIKIEDISDPRVHKWQGMWRRADSVMGQRTRNFEIFTLLAHNRNLFDRGVEKKTFSEGSTQSIKRKIRAQTIQRVPDGEIVTQYDKNSIEQVEIEYIFKHKVLTSEYDGKDMMKNLWRAFNAAYDYGFACIRTGFERDLDGDVRISWTQIPWNDVRPAPDCKFIEEAPWYMIRETMSRSELKELIDCKTGKVSDPTYNEDTLKYIIENDMRDAGDTKSDPMQDKEKGVTKIESVEVITLYKRGDSEFITYVPTINAVLRTVKNYDPRKDVPLHFLIPEPDPEFPLGCSSILWTISHQQFADAFQTTAYRQLLLSANPPLMVFGNISYPSIRMNPNALWTMGNNQNNRIEKFPVETTTITQYSSILENVSGNMMKNLNITDATVASDANVMNYSGTPQGVEQQRADKTITVNQYQKRVETFFAEWANHALRSYINSCTGEVELTVDEETRRRIWDVEMVTAPEQDDPMLALEPMESIIVENKIKVNFDNLSSDMLSFEVRSGSLIENEKEQERQAVQELILPLTQMISGVSEQNKPTFEKVIMQLVGRLCELSDIDLSAQTGAEFSNQLMMQAMQATMEQVMQQQQQIDQQGAALQQMQGAAIPGQMPPEQPMEQPMPMEQGMPPTELPPEMMAADQGAMPQMPPEVSAEFPEEALGAGEEMPIP